MCTEAAIDCPQFPPDKLSKYRRALSTVISIAHPSIAHSCDLVRNLLARRCIRTETREGKFEITLEPHPDILAYEIIIKGESGLEIHGVEPEVEFANKKLKKNRRMLTVSGPTVISAEPGYGSLILEIFAVCSVDVSIPLPELAAFERPTGVSAENWTAFTSHAHYSTVKLLLGVCG
jgi:hypothetical protein